MWGRNRVSRSAFRKVLFSLLLQRKSPSMLSHRKSSYFSPCLDLVSVRPLLMFFTRAILYLVLSIPSSIYSYFLIMTSKGILAVFKLWKYYLIMFSYPFSLKKNMQKLWLTHANVFMSLMESMVMRLWSLLVLLVIVSLL